MADTLRLNRRKFIIGSGAAGLSIGVLAGCGGAQESDNQKSDVDVSNLPPNPEVNAWVHIAPDDTVTIRIARSEMGQGTLTGLAQLVAEELECDWEKVVTEYPTPGQNVAREQVWGSFSTGGSQGIRSSQQYVREGGAAARMMLIEAAANEWGVPASECTAANSVISHAGSGQSVSYGKVAAAAAELAPPLEVTLKDPSEWKVIGQPLHRLDTDDKLIGKQIYGADLKLDGMLNASIKQAPKRNAKLASFDASAVTGMPGVRNVMQVGDNAVVVVADLWWQANTALDALPVEWEGGDDFNSAEFEAELDAAVEGGDAGVGNQVGDVNAALDSSETVIEAVYNWGFQNHAPMEPMNATAMFTEASGDEAAKIEVWCPHQNGMAALAAAAEAAELEVAQAEVYKLHLGGGFGRRGMSDYVTQVVQVAKQMPGTPVKLLWTREEDQRHGFYHPGTKAKVRGGVDADGNLTGMHIRIAGQSILAALIPQALQDGVDYLAFQGLLPDGGPPQLADQTMKYTFPAFLAEHAMRNPPVRPGFWRGVNANQNAIYLDCFLDELAHAAGRDPLDFRLQYLDDKGKKVLQAVADESGWGNDDGRSRGLCMFYSFGSYTAACAEVTVSDDGELKMHRIVAATDP
ncbi:MAG: molybdopterin cofactor-binding domain-containing protein, partial [Pseudomonadota bacterium]